MIIPCRHGHICPWGDGLLAACTDKSGRIAKRLWQLPFVDRNASQRGTDGVNAVFPLERFAKVAAIMKAKRIRKASTAQLAALGRGRAAGMKALGISPAWPLDKRRPEGPTSLLGRPDGSQVP